MVLDISAQSSLERRLIRQAIVDTALKEVGNYEKTNKNDGKASNKYALANGGKYGDSYCSWGIIYCTRENGIKLKINAQAISWTIPEKSIIRKYGKVIRNMKVNEGDVAVSQTYDYYRLKYQNHVEIVLNYNTGDDYCYTVGFNTWSNYEHGKRRQGVWIHKRLKKNLIICNQLQFYFEHEKDKVHRIATILSELQRVRL